MTASGEERATEALTASGIGFTLTRHGRVGSLAEAAAARGVEPCDIVKTLVVRRADDDFLFVLVPGDREISWPKLRAHLGVNRVSMPDAATALQVTGYERGTITPFGSSTAWPVVADATMTGRTVSLGAGAHGVAATVAADDVVRVLGADVIDVTDPAWRARTAAGDPDPAWPEVVRSVAAPTLVVAGGPRSFVAAEHVAELVAALPDGRSVTLDTGHEVHEADPEGFTRELLTFLD